MTGNEILEIVKELERELPYFDDGRIDYTNADSAAVVTVFVQYDNKILLLRRSKELNVYPELWNTVSGYLDEVKPIKEKVYEELSEEIGVTQENIDSIKYGEVYEFHDSDIQRTWIIHPVLVTLKQKPDIQLDWEHSEYTWINLDELDQFDCVPKLDKSMEISLKVR